MSLEPELRFHVTRSKLELLPDARIAGARPGQRVDQHLTSTYFDTPKRKNIIEHEPPNASAACKTYRLSKNLTVLSNECTGLRHAFPQFFDVAPGSLDVCSDLLDKASALIIGIG